MFIKIRENIINSEYIIWFKKNKIKFVNDDILEITEEESKYLIKNIFTVKEVGG